MYIFEFENDSGARLNQMTRPDQDISRINPDIRINPDSRINSRARINSLILPTFNIPLTRPSDFELLTRPTDFELLTRPKEFSEKNEK